MTYLDLINAVLVRLREDTVDSNNYNSDPYFKFIGSAVNDAKDRVEDAWQWTNLRGSEELVLSNTGQITDVSAELTDSADNTYLIKDIIIRDNGQYMHLVSDLKMRDNYRTAIPSNIDSYRGTPREYVYSRVAGTVAGVPTGSTGNRYLTVFPAPDKDYNVSVNFVRHQDPLVAYDDVLTVPSLPVYTLATALASRERGEVGGTPTSELFAIADRHLSDAIANDSALVPSELDWYTGSYWNRTNIKTAN